MVRVATSQRRKEVLLVVVKNGEVRSVGFFDKVLVIVLEKVHNAVIHDKVVEGQREVENMLIRVKVVEFRVVLYRPGPPLTPS